MANDLGAVDDAASPDTVWANEWNPPTDEWSPSAEPHNTWGVAQPGHGDLALANPMVDEQGHPESHPPTTGGSIPDARDNLLTDVKHRMAVPPPPQVVHHVVENVERGAESINVRQITVVGNVAPTQLLEANPNRRRALVRVVPTTPGSAAQLQSTFASGGGQSLITVPVGQTWTLAYITFQYAAGAGVANRQVQVTIKDNLGRTLYQFTDPTALTANQTAQVSLAPGNTLAHTAAGGTNFSITGNLPAGMVLPAGSTITVTAIAIDATDNINNGAVVFAGASTAVFVAARQQPGSASAPLTWFKLISGDGPLEVKCQDGLDGIGANSTDSIAVQVYEELVGSLADTPGIGV